MFSKIRNSLLFRLPVVYKFLLKNGSKDYYLKKGSAAKEWPVNLVILCGKGNEGMLHETLKSILRTFSSLPMVHVFTDKGLPPQTCRDGLSWFPQDRLQVISKIECLNYHTQKQNKDLIQFAEKNPMGLKMAAILQVADKGEPLLYCDTDVLWHNDPYESVSKILSSESSMAISYDFQPAYDENLVEKGGLTLLKSAPFYCAGILLLKEFNARFKSELNRLLPIVIEQSNHFSEQTLFAHFQKLDGLSLLDQDKYCIITEDQLETKKPEYNSIFARHYIGPVRHLFWRDAYFSTKK